MSTDSKKLAEQEDVSSEQEDKVCVRYEGSYIKLFFALVCAIISFVYILNVDKKNASIIMSHMFFLMQIVKFLIYIVAPFVIYLFIEISTYLISGIKPNIIIYRNHLEYNQNRFGLLNYNLKYTNIDRIESNTMRGTSILSVYFKEPLTEASFFEFRKDNILAKISKIVSKGSYNLHKMEILSTQFGKDAYDKICCELARRTSDPNKEETSEKSTVAA